MSDSPSRRYAIISPVRNEGRHVRETLASVVSQVEPPVKWVVVDDGSTDNTGAIVADYAQRASYIQLLALDSNNAGASVDRLHWAAEARAFNEGLAQIDLDAIDYVVKLDGDLRFGPDYFSRLLDEFEKDGSLGIAGGHCYEIRNGVRVLEWVPESHVRGATKMYRIACFREVDGVQPVYGWDTLDEIKAQMAGWRTASFHLDLDHLKPTGSASGLLRGRARMGMGAYLLGYHPLFVLVRSAKMALARPFLVSGVAFLHGYLMAAIRRSSRVADDATVRYLRAQQLSRLRRAGDMREIGLMLRRDDR